MIEPVLLLGFMAPDPEETMLGRTTSVPEKHGLMALWLAVGRHAGDPQPPGLSQVLGAGGFQKRRERNRKCKTSQQP